MAKKRIKSNERYIQLLDCATMVFAKKGYADAKTKDISKAADISEKMIYVHFKSKQELFLKCLNRVEVEMRMNFIKIIKTYKDNPLTCLEQIASFLFDYISKKDSPFSLLVLHAREVNDTVIKAEYKKTIRMYVDTIETTVKKAIEKGVIPSTIDPRAAAWIYVGTYITFVSMKEFKLEEFNKTFAKKVIDTIITYNSPNNRDPLGYKT